MRKFKLTNEQIEFLKEMYPDNELVQRVLNSGENGVFEIDVDTKIDFMDYIDDAPCMVEGLESIANAQNVVKKLYDRGYSENEVKAICFDNAYHYILPYLKY